MDRTPATEASLFEIGRLLYDAAGSTRPRLFRARGLRAALLARALRDEDLKRALFQFIDALPQLQSAGAVADHFRAYLDRCDIGGVWGGLMALGRKPLMAWAVRLSVTRVAQLFLVEESRRAVAEVLRKLARAGAGTTLDAVGEAVLTEAEADAYTLRNQQLLAWQHAAGASPHLSLKLSGLTPRFDPLDEHGSHARVLQRLARLMPEIIATRAAVTIDMEQHELKSLVISTFRAVVEAYPSLDWQPGIALQAYLRETDGDIVALIEWARRIRRRIAIRLVKGAYWDTEVALAAQRNWREPVYLDKAATDANYERLTRLLFDNRDAVYPAIAGHNLRSLAHAIAAARERGMTRDDWEIQMLYGMAEPLQHALGAHQVALRVYVPTGDAVTGIAYLIRRLLENTAGSSILRQTYVEGEDVGTLLLAPQPPPSAAAAPAPAYANTPLLDFSRDEHRQRFGKALAEVRSSLGRRYVVSIAGAPQTSGLHHARNPAAPDEILGAVELTSAAGALAALANAADAFAAWREVPAADRIALVRRAAAIMRERRAELAAWEVLEQAKNWREADADVAEAIDYLEYYAAEMERLDGWRVTSAFPGETNTTRYEPRGVAVIVAPWNFPFGILTGMTAAALVSGNCALMKPALAALITAHLLHGILLEAGFPSEVCQLVPGRGSEIGDVLVDDPRVHIIAFTGSREIGLRILERSARPGEGQPHVKRVVCEMGGKNAIIVDEDADLDEVVRETLHSAFGYQGQKCSACSRLIVVGAVHETLVARLSAALDAHAYGPPEDPQFVFGPLITQEAQQKTLRYIEIGRSEGRLAYQGTVPAQGYYVPPTIFTGIEPGHRLAQEEIFGPVLSVLRAETFDHALSIALDSQYALTGGVFSRYPEHLLLARERFRTGNLYLNRRITGARVSAQPFGGYRLSGTGIQAGGEDYLKQFLWSRVVTENTIRRGYVG
jgi:RHH-type proline utilization regulon transcriptional repressor/proline dehydrogenase/delta 1-pyrroline-5-carboxylate dehydrogenase